ncbi:MAG: mechanosensitive ion channel family protein [Endomicrobium sp.]|jgi:small-conductance mechanosensitive channel|nr:mechanosensitive ion channel family protein [Endomicrobium sp.]
MLSKYLLANHFDLWLKSFAVFAAIFFAGFLFRAYLLKFLRKAVSKIGVVVSDDVAETAKSYISFWIFLTALYAAFIIAPFDHTDEKVLKSFYSVIAISIVFLASSLISKVFRKAVSNAISVNIIKFSVIFIGVILIINQIGVNLTPVLTALGVGSLAVALALQDTLGNFFAGVNILASKQIMRGDYIRLDSGQEGRVVEINWRTTRIREMSNSVIVVPNTKISSAIVKNFHFNRSDFTSSVSCGVSYGSDLEKVEKTAIEAAAEVINAVEGAVKEFVPVVRFSEFAESSINFTVYFRVKDVYANGEIMHKIIKNIKKRFDEEHIEIPFPQRVVQIQKN